MWSSGWTLAPPRSWRWSLRCCPMARSSSPDWGGAQQWFEAWCGGEHRRHGAKAFSRRSKRPSDGRLQNSAGVHRHYRQPHPGARTRAVWWPSGTKEVPRPPMWPAWWRQPKPSPFSSDQRLLLIGTPGSFIDGQRGEKSRLAWVASAWTNIHIVTGAQSAAEKHHQVHYAAVGWKVEQLMLSLASSQDRADR